MTTFNFNIIETATAQIDIPDIGNIYLRAKTSLHDEYYLAIKTDLGWSKVIQYGPVQPDFKSLTKSYFSSYDELEYKESNLSKIIDKFLNRLNVAAVDIIEKDDFINNYVDVVSIVS